jgi:hypothetical protein
MVGGSIVIVFLGNELLHDPLLLDTFSPLLHGGIALLIFSK